MLNDLHPDRDLPEPETETTLAEIERLQTDRTHRDARRAFFVEGVRNVVQAIENGFGIETFLYSDRLLTVPIARRLVHESARSGVPVLRVSPEAFRRVSRTHRASGVGAIVAQRWSPLHGVSPKAGLCGSCSKRSGRQETWAA
jgi:TrmH family RNA methyltransferase